MRRLGRQLFLAILITVAGTSVGRAGVCAEGYIVEVAEGAFGLNDLFIKMKYTSSDPPNDKKGYLVFRETLPPKRLRGIRALAYLAVANGNKIEVRTVNKNDQFVDDCTNASELKILGF